MRFNNLIFLGSDLKNMAETLDFEHKSMAADLSCLCTSLELLLYK